MSNFDNFMLNFYIYVKNYKFMSKWFGSICVPVTWFMSKILQEPKPTALSIIIDIQNATLSCICNKIHSDVNTFTCTCY